MPQDLATETVFWRLIRLSTICAILLSERRLHTHLTSTPFTSLQQPRVGFCIGPDFLTNLKHCAWRAEGLLIPQIWAKTWFSDANNPTTISKIAKGKIQILPLMFSLFSSSFFPPHAFKFNACMVLNLLSDVHYIQIGGDMESQNFQISHNRVTLPSHRRFFCFKVF